MRKLFHVFLSLMIVYASTTSAFAASGWTVTNAVSTGSRTVVTATKGGYKSAVNLAPSAGRLALKIGKGANWAALLYAAIEMAPDLADIQSFQPNYNNGTVSYDVLPADGALLWSAWAGGNASNPFIFSSAEAAGRERCRQAGFNFERIEMKSSNYAFVRCIRSDGYRDFWDVSGSPDNTIKHETISIAEAAARVAGHAASGHAASKELMAQTATEMVVTGDFDKDLLSGAVPNSDSRPLIPSAPITGNGNVASGDFDASAGGGSGVDGGMTGGDVGAAADAARAAAEAAKKAAAAAAEVYKEAKEAARVAADEAADVVNSAVDQALKDIAEASAQAAKEAADTARAVDERAKSVAEEAAKEARKTAEKVKEQAEQSVRELRDIYEKALEEDKALALEKVKEAEKALEKAKEREEEAVKELEKAKEEAAKPFELPAFCGWAAPVCDAIEWLKRDPVAVVPLPVDVDSVTPDSSAADFDVNYVNFGGQCPVLPSYSINIMGVSVSDTFDMTPLCNLAVTIRPAIIAMAYFIGLGIVASSIRGA